MKRLFRGVRFLSPVLLIILVFLGFNLSALIPAFGSPVQGISMVYLSPGVWSVAPGGSFWVTVMVNLAPGQNISAIDVKVNYTNPRQGLVVNVDNFSYSGNIFGNDLGNFLSQECVFPLGPDYDIQCPQSTDYAPGWVHFSELGGSVVSGPKTAPLFSIHFHVDGRGTSLIQINSALLVDTGSGSFPTPQFIPVTTQDGIFSNAGTASFFQFAPQDTPTVVAGYDNRFNATGSLSFNTSYTQIPITSYFWNFGDGTTDNTSSPNNSHVFGSAGHYDVNLTIVDANGNRGSSYRMVTVGPAVGALFLTVVDMHLARQPGVDVQIFNLTALTPFVNETTDFSGTVSFQNLPPGTYKLTFSGRYVKNSTATETIIASWTTQDTIGLETELGAPAFPLAVGVICPSTSTVGTVVSCTASPTGGTPPYTFTWTATGGSPPSGTGSRFSTTYNAKDTYTISAILTDSSSQTATDSATVTINPLAFAIAVNCPAIRTVETAVSCSATSSGGTLPTTFAWTATDGSPSSGTGSSFSTIFSTLGTHTISVTGTDSSSPPNAQTRSAIVTVYAQTAQTAPSLAATTNQKTVFQFPSERAMFYAQGRTWIFFTNNQMGAVIPGYATSADGQTWAQYSINSIAGTSANSSTPISAITNGTHVFLAWYQGSYGVMSKPLLIGIGRLNSDGTIAWNSAITAVSATTGQRWYDPNLSLNADGTLFLSYRNASSTDAGGFAFATTAVAPYTSWSSAFTLKASADTWRISWINLNNGQEYVLYSPAGGCLRGRLYNGGFGSEEIICNPTSTRYVAFGFDNGTNTPTVIYQESNTERLMITYRVGGMWQTPRLIGYAETNRLPQWSVTFVPSLAKYYLIYYNYTTGTIWDYNGNVNSWSPRTLLFISDRGDSNMSIISYPIAADLTSHASVGFAWTSGDASNLRVVDINFGATTVDPGPARSGSPTQLSIQSSVGCCQPSPYLPWILVGIVATTVLITVIVNRRR